MRSTKLSRLVLRAVAKLGWRQPSAEDPLGRHNAAHNQVMLAILTYCYAPGLYSSRDIAMKC